MNDASSSSVTVCRMSWVCSVLRLRRVVHLSQCDYPSAFRPCHGQLGRRAGAAVHGRSSKVTAISRIGGRSNTTLSGVLMPSLAATLPTPIPGARSLCGNAKQPSTLSMRLTRGFARVNLTAGLTSGGGSGEGDKSRDRMRAAMEGTTAGLLLVWEAGRLSECDSRSEPNARMEKYHFVSFEFNINSAIHVEMTTVILDTTTRVSILQSLDDGFDCDWHRQVAIGFFIG